MTDIAGECYIADEVVATIASSGFEGVNDLKLIEGSAFSRLGKKNIYKGVRVKQEDKKAYLDAKVTAMYGSAIKEVGLDACEKMASKVEELTGLTVDKIHIKVEQVEFE